MTRKRKIEEESGVKKMARIAEQGQEEKRHGGPARSTNSGFYSIFNVKNTNFHNSRQAACPGPLHDLPVGGGGRPGGVQHRVAALEARAGPGPVQQGVGNSARKDFMQEAAVTGSSAVRTSLANQSGPDKQLGTLTNGGTQHNSSQ